MSFRMSLGSLKDVGAVKDCYRIAISSQRVYKQEY